MAANLKVLRFANRGSKKSQNRGLRLPKILLKTLQDGPFWGGSQNGPPKIVLKTLQDGPFWGGSEKTEGVGWPRDAYFGVGCKKWKASGGLETPRNAIFDCPPPSPFHDHGRRQRRRTCDFGGSFHRGLPLTCGVNLSRLVQNGSPAPGNGPESILGPSGMRHSFKLDF